MARHLSTKQLTSWFNGAATDPDHIEHLDNCTRCANKVEELHLTSIENNVEPISPEFKPALMAVLQPPEDLHERISIRIAERLQDRDDANLFGSLLGLPVDTTRLLTSRPKPNEN